MWRTHVHMNCEGSFLLCRQVLHSVLCSLPSAYRASVPLGSSQLCVPPAGDSQPPAHSAAPYLSNTQANKCMSTLNLSESCFLPLESGLRIDFS